MSSEIAIRVESLSKCYHIYDKPRERLLQMLRPGRKQYYREFWALRDVSFEVKRGETLGIVGRNGSGKSTLLQIICGTLNATSGTVKTIGRIAALLELGAGFNPEFTGRENVYMNGAVLGLTRDEIDNRYDRIAAFADIGEFLDQPVKTYSSGMSVRLAFAVQATVDPDILIVDEALAVGDEKFQRKCFARLEQLKSDGASILFVSHSGPQVVELCDRALLVDHGKRLLLSSPPQVIRAYQRLIYAPAEEQERLTCEYQHADHGGTQTDSTNNNAVDSPQEPTDISFDAGLIPETTTTYPSQGATILSIQIMDHLGNIVNVLHPKKEYQFVVSGHLSGEVSDVYFGIHVRSISGVVITGQRYPEEGRYVNVDRANSCFKVSFGFQMVLLPGTYFVGSGVWSRDESTCLHRVLDAVMFRVLAEKKSIAFGYVDASTASPNVEIF